MSWILPFLFVLTLVVTIHELGHYWAARAFGTVIDSFSIGWGRPIFKWRDKRGVEWRIGWIPIGGYVSWAGDANAASIPDHDDLAEMKAKILEHNSPADLQKFFHFKPVWQRAIITLAGPVANFILAIVLFAVLFGIFGEARAIPKIMTVPPGSPAAEAGLQIGDVVHKADDFAVRDLISLEQYISVRAQVPVHLTVERAGQPLELVVTPVLSEVVDATGARQKIGLIGIEPLPNLVTGVAVGSPASEAGFQVGDIVRMADAKPIADFPGLAAYVATKINQPIKFTVDRAGQTVELVGTPVLRDVTDSAGASRRVSLGLENGFQSSGIERVRYGPVQAVGAGVRQTWETLSTTFYYLGRLVRGQVPADQLGGFIGIAKTSDAVAKIGAEGAPNVAMGIFGSFLALLRLSAFLSVSVGFLNLLPIPVLDGGHLLFYGYEAVARRPLAANVQAVGYRLGLALLLGFMLFAVWNDLQRYNVFNFLGGLFS